MAEDNMTEKEIILNIINRLNLQNRLTYFKDGDIEFYNGWESILIEFNEDGSVKAIG